MIPKDQPPMLDYVTKMMLLEVVRAIVEQDVPAAMWIEEYLTQVHHRWRELDGLNK
jgi:hypothetical protein